MTFVEIGADFIESALFVVYLNLFNARRFRGGRLRLEDLCALRCCLGIFLRLIW